ncbi:pentapeptide repeat-containing protein [Candidatus Kirkpatrickella diaphorinae]|uniref:Pentapeptide repeat-containing protein n=1 Tax=Candidatus Kirkpatrickella diaphorinae TaxID=2984322 RepID=A0ABY6GHN6_9PROT|nr:pentapeptide repeat-containing protein [Candidatus Kirkpatrickella diaphorinae]UYH51022.1 pentapeptide repeat-containing protein [Candidatus Kirkpatrickella diaphorinae]
MRRAKIPAHVVTLWDDYADLHDGELRGEAVHQLIARKCNLAATDLRNIISPDAQFSGQSFAGCDLRGADLRRADLSGVDFSGADLSAARLDDANLSSAKFHGTRLDDAILTEVNASHARFCGAHLHRADFCGSNLSGADFSGAEIDKIRLEKSNIAFSVWEGVDMQTAEYSEIRWDGLKLKVWPIYVSGIDYRVILLPGYIVLGSGTFSFDRLRALSSRGAIEAGGIRALRFYAMFGPLIEALDASEALKPYLTPANATQNV